MPPEGGAEQVGGIALGLGLDISGFSAGISRARGQLAELESTPVRIRAQVAAPTRMPTLNVIPSFAVDRAVIRDFRAQINDQLRGLGDAGAVAVPIRLARINYAELRAEIAAGIGSVPIKVAVGGRGTPTQIVAATVAEAQGEGIGQAQAFVTNAARKRGLTPRRYGGPVYPGPRYLVGEAGPEVVEFGSPGYIHAARGILARAYEATVRQGGGTFGAGGQPNRGYAVGMETGTFRMVGQSDVRGFMRAYRDAQKLGAPYVGTWVNEGNIHVDPVEVLRRRREAERAARRNAQLAYYNMGAGEEITTGWKRRDPSPGQMRLGLEAGGEVGPGDRGLAYFEAHAGPQDRDFEGNLSAAHRRLRPHHIEGGYLWYSKAGEFGRTEARRHGVDETTGVGILAALSAGTAWKSNKTKYSRVLRAEAAGQPFPYGMRLDAHKKAAAILGGMDPEEAFASSPKVSQFYRGLMGDLNTLTLDRWAFRTATRGLLDKAGEGPVRSQIDAAWRKVALRHGMPLAVSQAALWLQEKEESLQAPGQAGMFAGGGFMRASEASALGRLRELTHPSGRILRGHEEEAQSLNLQIEQMRRAAQEGFTPPWMRRLREQGLPAKDYTGFDALARGGRAWGWESQPRDLLGRFAPRGEDSDFEDRLRRYKHPGRDAAFEDFFDLVSREHYREPHVAPTSLYDPADLDEFSPKWARADGGLTKRFKVTDPDGLHGRPSQFMAAVVRDYGVAVTAKNLTDKRARPVSNGTSLNEWLMLNARGGHRLAITASGERAPEALAAMGSLLGFNPYAAGKPNERASGYADFDPGIGAAYRRLYHTQLKPKAAGGYIVGERGPELFVPKRLEWLIPGDVMNRLPKRDTGGVVEIGRKPFSFFQPPEDGWVIPNHLRDRIPHLASGGRARRDAPGQLPMWGTVPLAGPEWTGMSARVLNARPLATTAAAPQPVQIVSVSDTAQRDFGQALTREPTYRARYRSAPAEIDALEHAGDEGRPSRAALPLAAFYTRPPRSEWMPESDRLRGILAGTAPRVSARTSVRTQIASLGSLFLGGREASETSRREAGIQIRGVEDLERRRQSLMERSMVAEAKYGEATDKLSSLTARNISPQAKSYRKALETQDKYARQVEGLTGQLAEVEKTHAAASQSAEAAAEAARPGGRNIAQNIVGMGVVLASYQAGMGAFQIAMEAAGPALAAWVDQMDGFASTSTRVTTVLGQTTTAMHGNAEAAVAQTAAEAGLSKTSYDYVDATLRATASVKAGATAQQQANDLLRGAFGAKQGAAPEGLFGGYGGVFGTDFLASQMGGGPGFMQGVNNYFGGINGANKGGPDVFGSVQKGLQFLTDPALQTMVTDAERTQNGGGTGPLQIAAALANELPTKALQTLGLVGPQATTPTPPTPGRTGFVNPATLFPTADKMEAVNVGMQQFNDAATRGAQAMGTTNRVTLEFAKSQQELSEGMAAAMKAGDAEAYKMARDTEIVLKVNGQVADAAQHTAAAEQAAVGMSRVSPDVWMRTQRQPLAAQRATTDVQVQRALTVDLPAQVAMSLIQNPLIKPGTGFVPSGGLTATGAGSTGAAAGYIASATSAQADLTQEQNAGLAAMRGTIGELSRDQLPRFNAEWSRAAAYSAQVRTITQSISLEQANLSAAQFGQQIFYLNRQLSDAKGLAGEVAGPDNLGALQRQSFMLGRQQTSLGLSLQQRQITTNLATASFQAPGASPEERYARREEALAQARIQQRQLNLSRSQFGVEGQIFNVSATRGVADTQRSIALAQQERQVAVDVAAGGQAIQAAEQASAAHLAKASSIYEGAAAKWGQNLSVASAFAAQFGGTLEAAMKALNDPKTGIVAAVATLYTDATTLLGTGAGVGAAAGAFGTGGAYGSNAGGPTNYGGGGRGVVDTITGGPTSTGGGFASGVVGMTAGPTHAYIGEAGREAVAIIRNPRAVELGATGGGTNVTVIVSGNSFSGHEDESRLVRRITTEVIGALNRKGQLVGLRGPAH